MDEEDVEMLFGDTVREFMDNVGHNAYEAKTGDAHSRSYGTSGSTNATNGARHSGEAKYDLDKVRYQ